MKKLNCFNESSIILNNKRFAKHRGPWRDKASIGRHFQQYVSTGCCRQRRSQRNQGANQVIK